MFQIAFAHISAVPLLRSCFSQFQIMVVT